MTDDLIGRLRECANGMRSLKTGLGDYGICDEAAATLATQAAEIEGLRALVAVFVDADDDARKNPMGGLSLGGLMDARDNSGVVYQSQALADALVRARARLAEKGGA